MSKAEEKSLKSYPEKIEWVGNQWDGAPFDINCEKRFGYQQGYHQAEKDLELTWRDIAVINDIVTKMLNDCGDNILYDTEKDFCQEVLKRFNKEKEKIDN